MKKICIFFIILALAELIGARIAQTSNIQTEVIFPPVPTSTPTPAVSPPVTLHIPKLGIDAHIESVGQDQDHRMDVPMTAGDTGWYAFGPKPGEVGNAVIDGHFDLPTGAPSVFYAIGTLKSGDTIDVITADNKTYTFIVSRVTSFPDLGFPINEVFGSSKEKNLNLITCSGVWDRQAHNYSNRTVVFAQLQ